MEALLWILAVILVIAGIVSLVRGAVLSGWCSSWSVCSSGRAVSASSPEPCGKTGRARRRSHTEATAAAVLAPMIDPTMTSPG